MPFSSDPEDAISDMENNIADVDTETDGDADGPPESEGDGEDLFGQEMIKCASQARCYERAHAELCLIVIIKRTHGLTTTTLWI